MSFVTTNRLYRHRLGPRVPSLGSTAGIAFGGAAVIGASAAISPAAPVLLAVAVAGAIAAWARPVLAAVVVTAAVPALSGIGRGIGVPYFKISEALLILAFVVVLLRRPAVHQRFSAADWAFAAFAIAGALFGALHVVSGDSSPGTFIRVGLQPTMLLMTWWTASRSITSGNDLRLVLRCVLLASTVPSALGILQALDAPGVRSFLLRVTSSSLPADPGVPGVIRVTGPFPIWHSLAAYLLIPVVIAAMLLLKRGQSVLPTLALVAIMALDVAALVLAVTITIIVWAVVAVLVVGFLQRRFGVALALVSVAAVTTAFMFAAPLSARINAQFQTPTASNQVPQTISYRIEIWRRDFLPLLGRSVGKGISNELPETVIFQNTENEYISLVLRGGVLQLLCGAGAVALAGGATAAAARRDDDLAGATSGVALGIVVFLPVACMIWPYLTNAGFPQAWIALAGSAVAASSLAGTRGTRAALGRNESPARAL
jgi:hypothetical protein